MNTRTQTPGRPMHKDNKDGANIARRRKTKENAKRLPNIDLNHMDLEQLQRSAADALVVDCRENKNNNKRKTHADVSFK